MEIDSDCSVTLKAIGPYPIRVIRAMRSIRNDLSIPQVKELLEHLPLCLGEDVGEREADSLGRLFYDAGASVEVSKPNTSTNINDWLKKQCSLDEIKTENPGGFVDGPVWQVLESRMQPGDEIWTFSSPDFFWKKLCGRGGYAIVRDGKVVSTVLTVMN